MMTRVRALPILALTTLAACTSVIAPSTTAPPPVGSSPGAPPATTGSASVPLSGPDSPVGIWYDETGSPLPNGLPGGEPLVLHVMTGHEHCGWQRVLFLSMGWPPGTKVGTSGGYHQYVRDPRGVLDRVQLAGSFVAGTELRADARYTGLERGPWRLWVVPGDQGAVFVVNGSYAERWPRTDRVVVCR